MTTQAAVLDLITGLARERQMATLFITDDLGLATEYCDRIIVMHAGHAVESAPTKALFARPRHPCTARLISSTPDDTSPIDSLAPVPGNLPDLRRKDLPACRLAECCEQVQDRCRSERPPLDAGADRATAGWFLDAAEGRIVFDGQDLAAIPAARFARLPQRADIQMVFQDPTDSLNPRYTARETIAEPLALLSGLRGAAAMERVDEVAAQVGLAPELLSRFAHQLSGGQKARLGIARAGSEAPVADPGRAHGRAGCLGAGGRASAAGPAAP